MLAPTAKASNFVRHLKLQAGNSEQAPPAETQESFPTFTVFSVWQKTEKVGHSSFVKSRGLDKRILELSAAAVATNDPAELERIMQELRTVLHQKTQRMHGMILDLVQATLSCRESAY